MYHDDADDDGILYDSKNPYAYDDDENDDVDDGIPIGFFGWCWWWWWWWWYDDDMMMLMVMVMMMWWWYDDVDSDCDSDDDDDMTIW